MQFNNIDYLIIAVLVLSSLIGLRKGLFLVLGSIIGLIAGLTAAFTFNRELAQHLEAYFGIKSLLITLISDKLHLPVLHPKLFSALGYDPVWADPISYFAELCLAAISFLLILIVGSKIIQILCYLLNFLLARGILSGFNRGLGMFLMFMQNLIIMAVLAGLLFPPVELLADMGMPGAVAAARHMEDSILFGPLLQLFDYLKIQGQNIW